MADYPKTLTRKRDGAERVVDNPREQVSAEFDGFAFLTAGQKASATKAAKAAATERGETGPAAAKTATPSKTSATAKAADAAAKS